MKKSSSSGVTHSVSSSSSSRVIDSSSTSTSVITKPTSSIDEVISSSPHSSFSKLTSNEKGNNDPSSCVNVSAIRCHEVSPTTSIGENRESGEEVLSDRKQERRSISIDDKRQYITDSKFGDKKTSIGLKICERKEDGEWSDVVVTSEPFKQGVPEISQRFSGKNSSNGEKEKVGKNGRKLTETGQEGKGTKNEEGFSMMEDKVDNKSHSSLNFDSIEEETRSKRRNREKTKQGKEKDDSSKRNMKNVLYEKEDEEKKSRKRIEVTLEKGGIKSGRLKRLTHPLDRSVSYVFTVTIFFTFIALVSGLPILITISTLLPITWIISYIFSCEIFHKITSWDKVTSTSSASRTGLIPLTPMELYWANDDTLVNNYRRGIATCLLYFDHGLTLEQFKDVLVARVLSKDSMARFRATIVHKGVSRRAFWKVIPLEKLPLNSLVIQEPMVIDSKSDLRSYVYQVMNEPLNVEGTKCPKWKIILVRTSFINQVILIIRVHQSICDGIGLLSTLIEQLADQAPPSTTTFIRTCQGTMTATNSLFKPRFGGINFSVNVFRAILAGPLTVILWILWSFTRRKYNFLQSFPFYSSPDYNDSCGIKFTASHHEQNDEGGECDDGKKGNRKGKRKTGRNEERVKGKRRHHHHHSHQHQRTRNESEEDGNEHSTRNCSSKTCNKDSCKMREDGNNHSSQQEHDRKHQQQLQQFDNRNMSGCEVFEAGAEKGVFFSPPSSTIDDKLFCKEFEQSNSGETVPTMVVIPPESVSTIAGGPKGGSGGRGRKLLNRAFGSHSPCSPRIMSATSERMRMSTGITSSSSISPSSSEKGKTRKDETMLQLQEDLLEVKSISEVGAKGGNNNMTTRIKGRMISLMQGGSKTKKLKGNRKTSRLPSILSNHSSCNSQGSKSSSSKNSKCVPQHSGPASSFPQPAFNHSLSSSRKPSKLVDKDLGGKENELDSLCDPIRSIHWSSVDLTKVYRVKQVTRSCLNDVVLTAISGSIRDYLVKYSGVDRPPNLALSIPVDVRVINDSESLSNKSGGGTADSDPSVSFVMLTSPLPTRTEGAIPRMWEVKQLTDEIKASPDAVVMYGPPMNITVNSHQLHSIQYFMSVPPTIPITFNAITYGHKLFVSVTSTSILIPSAKQLFKLFSDQIDLLADLLSKRRIPGESRAKKRPHHVIIEAPIGSRISGGLSPITAYSSAPFSTKQLLDRLHHVQYEVNRLNEALDEDCPDADAVSDRLIDLKAEFSHLVKQIRRRKSIAEYGHNIVFSTELEDVDDDDQDDDDDIDGEMRPPTRRFSFVPGVSTTNVARRSSIVSAISSFGGSSSSIISGRRSPGTMTASSSTSLEHPSCSGATAGHAIPQTFASRHKRFSLTPSTTLGKVGSGAVGSRSVPSHYQSPSDTLSSSPSDTTPTGSSCRSESIV